MYSNRKPRKRNTYYTIQINNTNIKCYNNCRSRLGSTTRAQYSTHVRDLLFNCVSLFYGIPMYPAHPLPRSNPIDTPAHKLRVHFTEHHGCSTAMYIYVIILLLYLLLRLKYTCITLCIRVCVYNIRDRWSGDTAWWRVGEKKNDFYILFIYFNGFSIPVRTG